MAPLSRSKIRPAPLLSARLSIILLVALVVVCLLTPPASAFQNGPSPKMTPAAAYRPSSALSVVRDPRSAPAPAASSTSEQKYQTNKPRYTDEARLRYQLQLTRDQMEESEMRATAAERRVARLQVELDKLKDEADSEDDEAQGRTTDAEEAAKIVEEQAVKAEKALEKRLRKRFDKQKEKLAERVRHFGDALQQMKYDTAKRLDEVTSSAAAEQATLQDRIAKLQGELDGASMELGEARAATEKLRHNIQALEIKSRDEIIFAKEEAQRAMDCIKSDAKKREIDLLDKSKLEQEQIRKEGELVIKEKVQIIAQLEGERQSIRKLVRVMVRLVKERIAGKFRRK